MQVLQSPPIQGRAHSRAMTPTIAWNPDHTLNQPQMDRTHQEFVDRLGALQDAVRRAPHEVADCVGELLRHTELHFEQEERWMLELGFGPENCHAQEHASVLEVIREAQRRNTLPRTSICWRR